MILDSFKKLSKLKVRDLKNLGFPRVRNFKKSLRERAPFLDKLKEIALLSSINLKKLLSAGESFQ